MVNFPVAFLIYEVRNSKLYRFDGSKKMEFVKYRTVHFSYRCTLVLNLNIQYSKKFLYKAINVSIIGIFIFFNRIYRSIIDS